MSNSTTAKIINALFLDRAEISLENSLVVRIFSRFYYPRLTAILLILALVIYWYEGLILKLWPSFSASWLAPALIILALFFSKKEKIFFYQAHLWYLLFLILALFSAFLALFSGLYGRMIFEGWLLFAQFGFALIAVGAITPKKTLLKIMVLAASPLALIGIYQFFTKIPSSKLWLSPGENLTRVFAFFGTPNVFGIVMAVLIILSVGLFLYERKSWWLAFSALGFIGLGFSFSRSAWFGLLAALIFVLFLYRPKFLLFLPLALFFLIIPQIRSRLFLVFSQNYLLDSSLDGRLWAIQNGLYVFKQYPLFGSGPGSYGGELAYKFASPVYLASIQNGYTALYFTDNQFLEILVQTGLLGLLAFLGFLISLYRILIAKIKGKSTIALTAGAVLTCFIVAGLFANVLEFGAVALPTALILGIGLSEKEDHYRL